MHVRCIDSGNDLMGKSFGMVLAGGVGRGMGSGVYLFIWGAHVHDGSTRPAISDGTVSRKVTVARGRA